MSNPLVSIVIPSYQQARFLQHAIDSALAQDHEPLEVLVMDGGSTDGSVEILRRYGDRVRWRSRPDGGQCQAINEGFRASSGSLVAWLNSDDFYYPGAISSAVRAFAENPDAGLVYGTGAVVDERGRRLPAFVDSEPFDLWRLANVWDHLIQPATFFRREALFEVGLLDEDLHWALDWDLWLRLGKRFPFARVEEPLAASRIHDDTKTATGAWRRHREIARMLARHGVPRRAPARVLHAVATLARGVLGNDRPLRTEALTDTGGSLLHRWTRPLLAAAERRCRRWMQNAQGVWSDHMVARSGVLWLPSDGCARRWTLHGQNLHLPGQVVTMRSRIAQARTDPLEPDQPFSISVDAPPGTVPLEFELGCRHTRRIGPLDSSLGPRRAGFRYDTLDCA